MADKPIAKFESMRIQDQQLAFSLTIVGAQGAYGEAQMAVYNAAGAYLGGSTLGRFEAGQPWTAALDIAGSAKDGDGDYAAWVTVTLTDENGDYVGLTEEGVSFLVGRGHIYPTTEKPGAIGMDDLPEMGPLRLEGDWAVADIKNPHAYDIPITHQLMVFAAGDSLVHHAKGQELLQSKATQQLHHLMPNGLANGTYSLFMGANVDGVHGDIISTARVEVQDGQITVLPS